MAAVLCRLPIAASVGVTIFCERFGKSDFLKAELLEIRCHHTMGKVGREGLCLLCTVGEGLISLRISYRKSLRMTISLFFVIAMHMISIRTLLR